MRPSVQQPISKDKNVMARTRKYYLKNNYLTLRSKVNVPQRSLWYATPPYGHAPTYQISLTYSKDKNVMAWTRKYYLKNNYLTLRSKVKVPRRSLRYVTHRLMVCTHIPNKYYLKNNYLTLRSKVPRRSLQYATHRLMVMHPHTKYH